MCSAKLESSSLEPTPVTATNGFSKPRRSYFAAIASTSVLLPLPFSPTKNVTPADVVLVVAVGHTARGSGPPLP
jgi:hypothetical protein